jgi:hypothetical protein
MNTVCVNIRVHSQFQLAESTIVQVVRNNFKNNNYVPINALSLQVFTFKLCIKTPYKYNLWI